MPPIRVLLVDDQPLIRGGLAMLLASESDIEIVGEANDGHQAVSQAILLQPDVIVMDISMPGVNGLAATRALKEIQSDAVIVTLTRHGDNAYLQELLRAGASGYVLKRSAPTELLHAIRGVAAGGQYLDSTLTSRVTAGFMARPGGGARTQAPALTEREAQVLRLIVREGMMVGVIGIGAGLAGALALSRVLASLVFDVQVRDPLTYIAVAAALALVALAACVIPARKASRVDPMVALRAE